MSHPDSDALPPSKSLRRKRKRRPLPKTGREFAAQVFDKLAEDRAARKHRTIERFGEEVHEEVRENDQQDQAIQEEEPALAAK